MATILNAVDGTEVGTDAIIADDNRTLTLSGNFNGLYSVWLDVVQPGTNELVPFLQMKTGVIVLDLDNGMVVRPRQEQWQIGNSAVLTIGPTA